MPSVPTTDALVRPLAGSLRGGLLRPGDDGYEAARRVFNARVDSRPAAIARCACAEDVACALRLASALGIYPAIRGGSHSVAGFGTCDGGLVIDVSPMKSIQVNPRDRSARVGAGATWRELDAATARFGLATPGGIVSSTGVAGLTLGGGVGWLVRKYGLSCDNLLSARVVTAGAELIDASDREHPDLFWALRGGGGNFGVVTELEFRLHPVSTVAVGRVDFDAAAAGSLLRRYRTLTETLSEDCTATISLAVSPDGRPVPSLVVCDAGSGAGAAEVVAAVADCGPVRDRSLRQLPYVEMQQLLDANFPAGRRHFWRSGFLKALDDDAIGVLAQWSARPPSPLSSVLLERYTGAASRVGLQETAFAHRLEPYNVHVLACWTDAADDDRNVAWAEGFWRALSAFSDEAVYVNFLDDEGDRRVRAAYGVNYERLSRVKGAYDPTNRFRRNHNILPSGARDASIRPPRGTQ